MLSAALLALAACTNPTAYGPADAQTRYGYSEEQLDERTWRVMVAGNSATPRELVEDQLLYRSAELARDRGAQSFVVIEQSVDRNTSYRGTTFPGPGFSSRAFLFRGFPRSRYLSPRRYGAFPLSTIGTTHLSPVDRYTAYTTVRFYPGEPPGGLGVPFDTQEVLTAIGPRIAPPADANATSEP